MSGTTQKETEETIARYVPGSWRRIPPCKDSLDVCLNTTPGHVVAVLSEATLDELRTKTKTPDFLEQFHVANGYLVSQPVVFYANAGNVQQVLKKTELRIGYVRGAFPNMLQTQLRLLLPSSHFIGFSDGDELADGLLASVNDPTTHQTKPVDLACLVVEPRSVIEQQLTARLSRQGPDGTQVFPFPPTVMTKIDTLNVPASKAAASGCKGCVRQLKLKRSEQRFDAFDAATSQFTLLAPIRQLPRAESIEPTDSHTGWSWTSIWGRLVAQPQAASPPQQAVDRGHHPQHAQFPIVLTNLAPTRDDFKTLQAVLRHVYIDVAFQRTKDIEPCDALAEYEVLPYLAAAFLDRSDKANAPESASASLWEQYTLLGVAGTPTRTERAAESDQTTRYWNLQYALALQTFVPQTRPATTAQCAGTKRTKFSAKSLAPFVEYQMRAAKALEDRHWDEALACVSMALQESREPRCQRGDRGTYWRSYYPYLHQALAEARRDAKRP